MPYRYRYFPKSPYRYRYRYFWNCLIDIDIDIFKNDHIDIDIDIFQKCRYIDNRYVISIYRTGLDDKKDEYGGATDYFDEKIYLEDSDEEEDAGNDDDKRKQLTIHLQLQLVH